MVSSMPARLLLLPTDFHSVSIFFATYVGANLLPVCFVLSLELEFLYLR